MPAADPVARQLSAPGALSAPAPKGPLAEIRRETLPDIAPA